MSGTTGYKINSGMSFSAIPEDKYQVEIYAVEPVMQVNQFKGGVEEEKLKVTFSVLDQDKTMLEDGKEVPVRGRRLWARFSKTLSAPKSQKPSNLTKLVTAAFGRELEVPELETFDDADLIGKQVMVMVNQTPGSKDGVVFNNILSYSKAIKQLPKIDDLEVKEARKENLKKSQSAIAESDFEKEMDELVKKKA